MEKDYGSRFEIGDKVQICMMDNTPFGWLRANAILMGIPADTGDVFRFHVLCELGVPECTLIINPMCGAFAGLIKFEEDAE